MLRASQKFGVSCLVGWFGFVYSLHVFALARCFTNSFTGLAMLALGVLPLSSIYAKLLKYRSIFRESLLPPDSCDNL